MLLWERPPHRTEERNIVFVIWPRWTVNGELIFLEYARRIFVSNGKRRVYNQAEFGSYDWYRLTSDEDYATGKNVWQHTAAGMREARLARGGKQFDPAPFVHWSGEGRPMTEEQFKAEYAAQDRWDRANLSRSRSGEVHLNAGASRQSLDEVGIVQSNAWPRDIVEAHLSDDKGPRPYHVVTLQARPPQPYAKKMFYRHVGS